MYVVIFSFGAILIRHLAVIWQECYGLGDLKECDGTHTERSAEKFPL
jgi:hypothetical protein